MIRVVISGLHFPLTMMGYFIKAFQRRSDVELVTAGPFSGNWIPWNGGIHLPPKYVHTPTIPLPQESPQFGMLSQVVTSRLPWTPDLWLQIDAGFHFRDKPKAGIVGHILTDPHCLMPQYRSVRDNMDVVFNMQNCYRNAGEQYLPYAVDPNIHRPLELEKVYDGCLVGLHYAQRDALVNRLRADGFHIYYSIGEIYEEYNRLYNQSRVALSWSSLLDTPARVYEAMGMAVPLLCNRTPDLGELFVEGDHYLGFDSLEEAVRQFRRLVNEPEFASHLASTAYRKVLAQHTWDHRVQQILETCHLI